MFKTHLNFEDHFQELRSKEAAINDYRQIIVNTKCCERPWDGYSLYWLVPKYIQLLLTYFRKTQNFSLSHAVSCWLIHLQESFVVLVICSCFLARNVIKVLTFIWSFMSSFFQVTYPFLFYFFFLQKRVLHNQQIIKLSN